MGLQWVSVGEPHLGILKQIEAKETTPHLFEDEELTRMELFYDTSKFLYDSLQVVIKEETQILKMVLVGLTTSLVTISTLSYDRVGGPQGRGCTNWGPVLMATASGTLAAAYTSFIQ